MGFPGVLAVWCRLHSTSKKKRNGASRDSFSTKERDMVSIASTAKKWSLPSKHNQAYSIPKKFQHVFLFVVPELASSATASKQCQQDNKYLINSQPPANKRVLRGTPWSRIPSPGAPTTLVGDAESASAKLVAPREGRRPVPTFLCRFTVISCSLSHSFPRLPFPLKSHDTVDRQAWQA